MGERKKLIEQAKLMNRFEGRWMDGVPAKIAQKVLMFFDDRNIDARAGQQEPEHQARRSRTDHDAALAPFHMGIVSQRRRSLG